MGKEFLQTKEINSLLTSARTLVCVYVVTTSYEYESINCMNKTL